MHRRQLAVVFTLALFATSAFAKDVYLSIGGTVGNFRTDMRIFNPSSTKDITVNAAFLEAGGDSSHPNNAAVQGKNITIPRRTMVVYDDVVLSLFEISGKLGAIRLNSPDDFAATQRIYANEAAGTLGQFVPGLDVSEARARGVVLQLKANGTRGQRGTFRTNVGFVNTANATTTVSVRLYGKSNTRIGGIKTITMQPFGVIAPSSITGLFTVGTADDVSDAFLTYEATNPIIAYGSVLDNGTEDPTYIPAVPDSGTNIDPPPVSEDETYEVTLSSFNIAFDPSPNFKVGDKIKLRIRSEQDLHGFQMFSPTNAVIVPNRSYSAGQAAQEFTFTVTAPGDYSYFCTVTTCGTGHNDMAGIIVATP